MKIKVSIITTAIVLVALLGNFLQPAKSVRASGTIITGINQSQAAESIRQFGSSASNKCTLKTSVSSKGVTVKWSVSNKKKSSFKNVQIKVATKKNMKSARTYKFSKSTAKKGSYQFTIKSGKVKANTTYYIQMRVKVKSKWTAWSSKKKVKTKKASKDDEEEEDELAKYKCKHELPAGATSKIVKAGGQVFDVHTYADEQGKGVQTMFKVYLMRLSQSGKKGVYAFIDDTVAIDYSKVSLSFGSAELWDWLGTSDISEQTIYSVPSYANAIADVYMSKNGLPHFFTVDEETVPHKVAGSYTVTLQYAGETLASTTRVKPACINNSIKLFRDYGGEEYLQDLLTQGPDIVFKDFLGYNWYSSDCVQNGNITPMAFSLWQVLTFNYFGCQYGTILGMSLSRYYCPGVKMLVQDTAYIPIDPRYRPELILPLKNGLNVYAPRYKQFRVEGYGSHVCYMYYNPSETDILKQWVSCGTTGSSSGPGKQNFPTSSGLGDEFDFLGLIYE